PRSRAMCAGGPPTPMTPMRPHSRAMTRKGTFAIGAGAPVASVISGGDATGVVAARARGQRHLGELGAEPLEHARDEPAVHCTQDGMVLSRHAEGTVVSHHRLSGVILLDVSIETVGREEAGDRRHRGLDGGGGVI